MRRAVRSAIVGGLIATVAAAAVARATVTAGPVVVHVIVRDATGSPVTGLTADAFEVRVDGRLRDVSGVTPAAAPSVVMLVDATQSTRWTSQDDAVEQLARDLQPADRVRMGVIARTPALSAASTNDRRQLVRDTRALLDLPDDERRGPSPIWDATMMALEALEEEPGHRAVILVSDGRASGNRVGLRDVAIRAISAGISVNSVTSCDARQLMRQTSTTAARVAPGRQLEWLATMTGGLCLSASAPNPFVSDRALVDQLRALHQTLGRAYALEIATEVDDGPNPELTVQVRGDGLTVHARRGFVRPR